MEIVFKSVKTNKNSIEKELLFTFEVNKIKDTYIPLRFWAELYSEDNKKIGNLFDNNSPRNYNLNVNAAGTTNGGPRNLDFEITFSCYLGEKAINHIEKYRLNEKNQTKDIVFKIKMEVLIQRTNITVSNLHLAPGELLYGKEASKVIYRQEQYNNPTLYDAWFLSGQGSPNIFTYTRASQDIPDIKIDLMTWVNNFTKYLGIGEVLVLELIQPDKTVFSKDIVERYEKAQAALVEMKKQFGYGEWKQAIIAIRPVFELFKNFDDFKQLLIDGGYTESTYIALKKSIDGYFGLISKFYHGLEENKVDVNPDIQAYTEDAYFAYSYSVSLMNIISQKIKRKLP
jgi:hypothetical protein